LVDRRTSDKQTGHFDPIQEEQMRTNQSAGIRRIGGQARWAGTTAAALAMVAATGPGVGHAADRVPARPSFDYVGEFSNVKGAPEGTAKIGGLATMVVITHATTTSINATGLDPAAVYIADVHTTACFLNAGSGPFLYDPSEPDSPSNAIWVPVTVDKKGRGTGTTVTGRPTDSLRAKSVVIHLKRKPGSLVDEATPPKLACADLPRVTS
jgi:hypothetical protein